MKCTEELMEEHETVRRMLRIMEKISRRVARLQPAPEQHFREIEDFLVVFLDKCHHVGEEQHLFPALERAGIPRVSELIGLLLAEHGQGRQITARLRQAFEAYRSPEAGAAKTIVKATRDYCTLLRHHIQKENSTLFPMAEGRIGEDEDTRLLAAFERLERERIGPGAHDMFQKMLSRLEEAYLQ
jgi:hemerythrin-like domain-containing protein